MNTTINKHALVFGFTSVFLIGLGLTIVNPVIPFMVEQYTKNTQQQATTVTLLSAIYAFSMFLAAPMLGALSDRFGRKIILISSFVWLCDWVLFIWLWWSFMDTFSW